MAGLDKRRAAKEEEIPRVTDRAMTEGGAGRCPVLNGLVVLRGWWWKEL